MSMTDPQTIQENQYSFPYHYIPVSTDSSFSQVQYWSWGLRYMGGLQVAKDFLNDIPFTSLLDVGCGDGRFLRELHEEFTCETLLGVDYSARAIAMAKALNPHLDYRCLDISSDTSLGPFDVATLIEVLEHIPPPDVPTFIDAIHRHLTSSGTLIITVPHINKPLNEKHFQHFNSIGLRHALKGKFEIIKFVYIDRRSFRLRLVEKLMAKLEPYFIINHAGFWKNFSNFYLKNTLYADSEAECTRIGLIAKKI